MEQAVEKICRNSEIESVEFGKYKEHKVTHNFDVYRLTHIWEYTHYDTLCCIVEIVNGRCKIGVLIGSNCWSQTDANNINGFLHCLEVPGVRVYRRLDESDVSLHYLEDPRVKNYKRNGNIRLKIDGNKTAYTRIVIEGEYAYH